MVLILELIKWKDRGMIVNPYPQQLFTYKFSICTLNNNLSLSFYPKGACPPSPSQYLLPGTVQCYSRYRLQTMETALSENLLEMQIIGAFPLTC